MIFAHPSKGKILEELVLKFMKILIQLNCLAPNLLYSDQTDHDSTYLCWVKRTILFPLEIGSYQESFLIGKSVYSYQMLVSYPVLMCANLFTDISTCMCWERMTFIPPSETDRLQQSVLTVDVHVLHAN